MKALENTFQKRKEIKKKRNQTETFEIEKKLQN